MRPRNVAIALLGTGALVAGLVAGGITPGFRFAHTIHPKSGKPIVVPGKDGAGTLLFNGWRITPAGRHIETGDMLLGGAFSPDGKTLAVVNAGWGPVALNIIDVATEKRLARISLGRAWNGVAWSPDGKKVYVGGAIAGGTSHVHVVQQDASGDWERGEGFKIEGDLSRICIAGVAASSDGTALYVLNTGDGELYVLDPNTGKTIAHTPVGDHPYACALSPDGKKLYVTLYGGSEVAVVNVSSPTAPVIASRIPTGAHPNALVLSADDRLYVSCANSNSVTVYDLSAGKALETVKTALTPKAPSGSTPSALALAPDGKTLYVANADNNDVAVIDTAKRGKSRVRGFIPTGWYPTAVFACPDGKRIVLGSGKGTGTIPNPTKKPVVPPLGFQYIPAQLNGLLSFTEIPDDKRLAIYTKQALANSPYRDSQIAGTNYARKTAIPTRVGQLSPIKHILYIIKENRTYDQVLGDVAKGNGDPNCVFFGQDVTPNHHAVADQFVLLDNLYCSGEVSEDGHPWSDAAIANDYIQRSWTMSYSGKGRPPQGDSVTDPPAGYIWQACAKKGLAFRNYGEMRGHKSLIGHTANFVGKGEPGHAPPGRDNDKADQFIDEFKDMEAKGTIPSLMVMSLGEDHTRGTSIGAYTPQAMVASNDQAIGKIVDAISHSGAWKDFAIFIIEDDAQNGPDHVNSHRTVELVASPYCRRNYVDSTHYTTCSMLRTMELILGLPPLTQYDASANPMFESFTDTPDLRPYSVVGPRIDLNARNQRTAYGAAESSKMDWSDYDRVDEQALNRILWHSIKGVNVPMPPPVRRADFDPSGHIAAPAKAAAASHRDRDDDD